ncbi:MAG TPA: hypothetical protein VG056_13495 [Pirellulales bacterium]|nr:hypothetical protein [Pirellulales bacterium]
MTVEENELIHGRLMPRSLLVGAIGIAFCLACWVLRPDAFFRGYLVGYIFCIGILLGCLAIEMMYRLTGGGWGEMIHRPIAAALQTLPLAALFFLPVIAGMNRIYIWTNASAAADPSLAHKSQYLNPTAFVVRAAVYFAIWLTLAHLLARWSRQLDRSGDAAIGHRLGILSGPGAVLFALADTFAAIDWQMSLEPQWTSTIFPVIFGIGQLLSGFAFATLAATMLSPHPRVEQRVGKLYLQDLGSLLLAFVAFWAYVSFAQFLLIWSGNLPEETKWYLPRSTGGWQWFAGLLALCQFALPFMLLLSRRIKRDYRTLGAVAAFILLMRFVDIYWQIIPAFEPQGDWAVHWLDTLAAIGAAAGIGGILLAAFLRQVSMLPLAPLVESTSPPEATHD